MNKIKLIFKGISEIVGGEELGLLILTDPASTRQLTIVCDKQMEYQLGLRMGKAAITDKMLPEALWKMIQIQTKGNYELIIYDIQDGQYKAMLMDQVTFQSVQMRASDAILMSYISSIPLYIEERLMMRQSVPFSPNAGGMSIPVNAISTDMLKQALDKAIDEENYELASHLRDELLNRTGKDKDNMRDERK